MKLLSMFLAALSSLGVNRTDTSGSGQSQFLTSPTPAKPIAFNLSLDADDDPDSFAKTQDENENRAKEMLAFHASRRRENLTADDEDAIISDKALSDAEKRGALQKSLHNAASNGEVRKIETLLNGPASRFVDINAPDEEGTAPIIYASCFGHLNAVQTLLDAGADIDCQDRRNQWTSLMWAITNRHQYIAKLLLDRGASLDIKSSSGRTAADFAAPGSDISTFLKRSGYYIGNAGTEEDFYDNGFSQDKFEQEMEENEMRRRMMMESSMNLEVDLSSLGMDERPESPEDPEEQQEFLWDRCLHDQMFVFQENDLLRILDIVITSVTPQRSPSQKPVPANILFLAARYAHYHASPELLGVLLVSAMDRINEKVEQHQWDMTVLAFWISNATLLLHYLKKDTGLVGATTEFQLQLVELINEIFILIIRDAERRMDKILGIAILDYETIPFDVEFAGDWKIFRKNKQHVPEPISYKPAPPNKKAQPQPRNVTSLLSSTLFVLDLYDIHSVITAQILSQLFYWIGAELFNHILSNKAYLARTKAMQIRMNVSVLEDWARSNNRTPEHYENGALTTSGEDTVESVRKHFTPVVQLLQWLQCFSSLGDNPDSLEALDNTLKQFTRLTPQQLLHASSHYRYEKDEKALPKIAKKRLTSLAMEAKKRYEKLQRDRKSGIHPSTGSSNAPSSEPGSPSSPNQNGNAAASELDTDDDELASGSLLMDPAHMLQFSLPTAVDLRVSYGAGLGGVNKERERKYIPTVPPEFLQKFDLGGSSHFIESQDWGEGDDHDG